MRLNLQGPFSLNVLKKNFNEIIKDNDNFFFNTFFNDNFAEVILISLIFFLFFDLKSRAVKKKRPYKS